MAMDIRQIAQMLQSQEEDKKALLEEEKVELVGFNIGPEEFAVDIHYVREIIELPDITRVPKAPHYVLGVINLRGHIVPVVDLAKRFNLVSNDGLENKVIVLEHEDRVVGVKVDEVTEVLRLPKSRIEPPHGMFAGIDVEFINGIGKRDSGKIVIILNVEKFLKE